MNTRLEETGLVVCDPEMMKLLQTIAKSMQKNHQTIGKNDQILHQDNLTILKKLENIEAKFEGIETKLDSIEEKLEEMAKRQLSAWLDSVKKFKEKLKNAKTPQEEAIYAQALKDSMPQEGELDTIIEDAFPEERIRNIVHEQLKMLGKNIGESFDVMSKNFGVMNDSFGDISKSIGSTQDDVVTGDNNNHNRYVALADRLDSIESIIRSIDSEVSKTYHVVNAMPRDHY